MATKEARFPAVKRLDSFEFAAIPSPNKTMVLELARCEYVARRENVIAVGNSGTGKTHIALGLGLVVCQKGLSVGFVTAAALVHEPLRRTARARTQDYRCVCLPSAQKLARATGGKQCVETVWGRGYRLCDPAEIPPLPYP